MAGLMMPSVADAQFDFLRSLFGPARSAPQAFGGDADLDAARAAAERGEVQKSLELVRTAMAKRAAPPSANDQLGQIVSRKLLVLCEQWHAHHADPAAVAETLREVVLPAQRKSEIWTYALPWQPEIRPWDPTANRLPAPRSVAHELVRWSVRAKSTASLQEHLQSRLKNPASKSIAEVLAVQLAVAENQPAVAVPLLSSLKATVGTSPAADEWILHAVHAALDHAETKLEGLRLLETVMASLGKPEGGPLLEARAAILLEAIPYYLALGRNDDAVRLATEVAQFPATSQQSGDELATHVRHLRQAQAAAALLNGHRVKDALDILAVKVDEPVSRMERYYSSPNVAAMLGRELQRLPAGQRYELLHTWTMPNAQRPHCRDLTEYVPESDSVSSGETALPAAGILHDIYSTTWHLIQTAQELGRLDELIVEFSRVPADHPEADVWQTLAMVVRDREASDLVRTAQTTQRLQALAAVTTTNIPKWEDNPQRPLPTSTCVVALEAARAPQWSTVAEELLLRLIEHTQRLQWDRPRPHLRMAWAEVQRRRTLPATPTTPESNEVAAIPSAWRDLQPRFWLAAGAESAQQHAGGSLDDVWLAHADSFTHLSGRFDSSLFFQFPLAGEFTLSMDVREGGWSEGAAGYGGIFFATNGYVDRAPLHDPGRAHYLSGPSLPNLLHRNPWNHQTVEVRKDVVRYRANGQVIHEDHPGEASPWLSLNADWGRTPIYRNLRFTGTPEIPAAVKLLDDHRLRGWVATTYSESRETPLKSTAASRRHIIPRSEIGIPIVIDDTGIGNAAPTEISVATDWYWDRDELRAPRRPEFFPSSGASRLYYHRPLLTGESIEYEFFAEPGEYEAHPTLGRSLLVLEPERLALRPLDDGTAEVRRPGPADQVVPSDWKLKQGDWNRVQLSLIDDEATIRVNGSEPVLVPVPKRGDRQFGFWHDAARTALRVREVILRGDWPQTFTEKHREAIERPQPTTPPLQRQFLTDILREEVVADNAYAVYQRALQLDGEARYDYLYRWVMPGPDHHTIRTIGALTPTHPAPPALANNPIDMATAEARQAFDSQRVQTGGSFVSPAVLLVFSALELGRLGELSDTLDRPDPTNSVANTRARAAMHGMIALLEDRIEHAQAALWDGNRLLLEGGSLPVHARWSEPALCSLAMLHPDTREAAFELIDRIQRRQLQSGQPGTSEFGRFVRQQHGQALYLLQGGDPTAFGTQPRLKQWQAVSQVSARTRGAGFPIASFDTIGEELALRGGHDLDMLYFQSPLRGNFEIRMRLTQFDYREFMPLVGGVSTVVKFDSKNMKREPLLGPIEELPLTTEIVPKARSWGDYKMVVQDGHYTVFVNGQKLYEQDLPPGADPWVAIQGRAGYSSRLARNVIITGQPEIPAELDLLAPPDLQGWQTDYYGSRIGESPYPWQRDGAEVKCLQSHIRDALPEKLKVENVLRYHRPLLEDGVIAYEFYYDPDAKMAMQVNPRQPVFGNQQQAVTWQPAPVVVHPALDRMVFLLEPEGIKLHWLTDGRYDRTGMTADNVSTIPGVKPLPLKLQAWNAVRVAVTGDAVSLSVNEQLVLRHPIDPTNQRHFGLFHFVNESTARVRNVRYRGEWPRLLPTVEQQELATGPERSVVIPDAELPARIEYDLTRTPFDPQKFAYVWDAKVARFMQGTPQGFRLKFPAGESKGATVAGFAPRVRVKGDFIATMDYTSLTTTPVKEAWGCGLSFKLKMHGSYDAGIEIRRTTTGRAINCIWQMPTPGGSNVYYAENFSEFPEAGRLRLVRRGATVYYLIADVGSDEFRLLTTRVLGTTDIDRIGPQVDCSDAAGGADVLITHLEIQAQELVPFK